MVDAFVRTAPQSAAGGASNNIGGSGAAAGSPVYHGHNRGLAGNSSAAVCIRSIVGFCRL